MRRAATEVVGEPPEETGVGYWMDAALFAETGIPVVDYGPSGAGAHEAVEWVDVASVVRCARVLEAAVHGFFEESRAPTRLEARVSPRLELGPRLAQNLALILSRGRSGLMPKADRESSAADEPREITVLLQAWRAGDAAAAERLFERIYPELKKIAHRHLRSRGNLTAEPTEIVHETYLKMEAAGSLHWGSRLQFYALASQIVRQVLVDRFRSRGTLKRGSAEQPVELQPEHLELAPRSIDLLALDEALARLAAQDPEAARIVELRHFAGLTIPEVAELLDLGTATVSRRWQMARAWLRRELGPDAEADSGAQGAEP